MYDMNTPLACLTNNKSIICPHRERPLFHDRLPVMVRYQEKLDSNPYIQLRSTKTTIARL